MKKLMVLILLAAGLTFTAKAQDGSDTQQVLFGFKAGFNISNVYDKKGNQYDTDAKLGLVAGAFVAVPIGTSMSFQPELLFSQKGFRGAAQALGTTYEYSRTTSYVDIPLLIGFKPGANVSILAGPHVSYLLAHRDKVKSGDFTAVHDQNFSNDNPRRNTVGLTTGLDFNVNPLVLGARIVWDFTDNNGDGTSSKPTYKNAWIQGTIGFTL